MGKCAPTDELTDDALTGGFRIFQRRRGHRYSLDDTLTAWEAARARPAAREVVDLGCGIGSVLLMLAYKLPAARFWGVEAQAESHALCTRNVARNGVGQRVELRLADLRDPGLLSSLRQERPQGFGLVTGTPPYKKREEGTISPDLQRAHARVELRGGVEAYLEAAAQLLAPNGLCVVCAEGRANERVLAGARAAALQPLRRLDVVPAGLRKGVLFCVWTLCPSAEGLRVAGLETQTFVARDDSGARTAAATEVRAFFDLKAPASEPKSPVVRRRSQGKHV